MNAADDQAAAAPDQGIAKMGGTFISWRRGGRVAKRALLHHNNRLKRAHPNHRQQPVVIEARIRTMDTSGGGEEFIGYGGASAGLLVKQHSREGQQRILPVYELLIRSGEATSASLRIAIAQPGEPQVMRCAIPADSRRAFVPGTLSLHKDGRKVGRAEEGGNSISYEFVPWAEDDAIGAQSQSQQMQTAPAAAQIGSKSQRGIIRRRPIKRAEKKLHRKKHKLNPRPILFHCSASVFPSEAQRRGRLPMANTYQRTLKMTPWQGRSPAVMECPPEAEGFCKNGGKCVQLEPAGARYCLCANNFNGRYCERISAGLIGTMPLSALFCLSSAGLLLLLLVILLSGMLARERRTSYRIRKASKTMKAVAIRLEDKEEQSADTPLEDFYDTADGISRSPRQQQDQESPPSSAATLASSPCSPSPSRIPRLYSISTPTPQRKALKAVDQQQQQERGEEAVEKLNGTDNNSNGGYDNLERLREEIQRQKVELEARKAAAAGRSEREELSRSPGMDSLPSRMAPSPPKSGAGHGFINLMSENLAKMPK